MHKIKKPKGKPIVSKVKIAGKVKWPAQEAGKKVVLNIINANVRLPKIFDNARWQEVTASLEMPNAQLPIDIRGLSAVPADSCDAIWNAGSLCYLQAHEVMPVLKECYRILRHAGVLMFNVADLQRIGTVLAQGKPERELYRSPAGGIAAIDLLFGHRPSLQAGRKELQVQTGFTAGSIANKLTPLGFGEVEITREGWMIYVVARKIAASPPDKPMVRIREEDLNEAMRTRDNINKEPEWMKITPPDAFQKNARKTGE